MRTRPRLPGNRGFAPAWLAGLPDAFAGEVERAALRTALTVLAGFVFPTGP